MKCTSRTVQLFAIVLSWTGVGLAAEAPRQTESASPASPALCAPGAYRSTQGDLVAVVETTSGVRFTSLEGARGDLGAPGAAFRCDQQQIRGFGDQPWTKVSFKTTQIEFLSKGTRLHGILLEPENAGTKPPLVVLVHGSEKTSPNGSSYQLLYTAQGVATFAYDKRGTGRSHGVYTQDFIQLAEDAAQALQAARNACVHCFSRVGFHGGSQGGWIAPLAALKAHADFVEVDFGVVGTALEQDQWQVDYQLRQFDYQPGESVHSLTGVTARVAASDFTEGYDQLAEMRRKFGSEPWFAHLDGQYTGELIRGEIERARDESPAVPWHYDGIDTIKSLKVPQLWIFAGEDSVAPSATSIGRLQQLHREGVNITVAVYPHTDHGISTFVQEGPGSRRRVGLADGYLRMMADWAKGSLSDRYGDAQWVPLD
jgi:dienelactone hydrolase